MGRGGFFHGESQNGEVHQKGWQEGRPWLLMPAGRPTDFDPKFGEEILALMSEGISLAAAAAELGIHRQRVYEWEERFAEFADTIKVARGKRQLFLERRLLGASEGPIVTSSIFALKNAAPDDWREKSEITGKDGERLIPESTGDIAAALLGVLTKKDGG